MIKIHTFTLKLSLSFSVFTKLSEYVFFKFITFNIINSNIQCLQTLRPMQSCNMFRLPSNTDPERDRGPGVKHSESR